MEDEEKSKGFKVQDRRRFSAEGDLKPEHQGEEPAPSQSTAAGAKIVTDAAAATTPEAPPAGRREAETGALGEMTFASFMVGLSTQALMHLGEIADPQSAPQVDLMAAQQLIDIIGMLQQKTRGNLDQHEQALVEEVLFELRMKYVERTSH